MPTPAEPRVLGTRSTLPPPFPRKTALVAGLCALLSAVSLVEGLAIVGAVVSGCILGAWLERRVYHALRGSSWLARWVVSMAGIPGYFAAAVLAALILSKTLGGGADGLVVVLILGGLWATGASLGSMEIVFIDSIASRLLPTFRGRLIAALLMLLFIAFATALGLSLLAEPLARSAREGTLNLKVDENAHGLTVQNVSDFIGTVQGSTMVVFGLALILLLPSLVSACAKLADAVMERILPLRAAFEAIGAGERHLRVEEEGSRDFRELSRSFNQMIAALAQAERMERAFGVYVSGHVLERIKGQHGDARLPPSLREASVFFADIRGFTAMSERLPPETVVAVLNRYFERVVAIIEAHHGYLNKFIGDAVVVVFNGPIDQPDHARRAVGCALALQEEVARLNREGAFPELAGAPLQVGVGVATGAMLCGNVGGSQQMEYTVIGDTVNLASRLTSVAPAGAVWISPQTAREGGESYSVEPLEPISLKGKSEPVLPYRVRPRLAA